MSGNARVLMLALCCVLAVSLGAAALGGQADRSGSGGGYPGDSAGGRAEQSSPPPTLGGVPAVVFVAPLLVLVAFAAFWSVYRDRGALAATLAFTGVVGVAVLFWIAFVAAGDPLQYPREVLRNATVPLVDRLPVGDGSETPGDDSTRLLSIPVLAGAVLLVAVLAVVAAATDGDLREAVADGRTVEEADGAADGEVLSAVGEAAGEAADRIDASADVDNEVYRAWHEMTTHLDVHSPRTSTPGEFAAAANDAGMDAAHVETLTELFRDVRYGGEPVTEGREQRAVDALRGIESQYAD